MFEVPAVDYSFTSGSGGRTVRKSSSVLKAGNALEDMLVANEKKQEERKISMEKESKVQLFQSIEVDDLDEVNNPKSKVEF
jgi:hypothetical protein